MSVRRNGLDGDFRGVATGWLAAKGHLGVIESLDVTSQECYEK